MALRCEKCGEGMSVKAKFCTACGAKAKEEKVESKNRKFHPIISILLGFIGLLVVLYFIGSSSLSDLEQGIYGAIAMFVFAVLFIGMLIVLLKPWLWIGFLMRHWYVAIGLVLAIIAVPVAIIFMANDASEKAAMAMLPLIQDSLSEAAAGKIFGDSGGSLSEVSTMVQRATNQVSTLLLPARLAGYRDTVLDWTIAVTAAARSTSALKALPDIPADFSLSLSDSMAREYFSISMSNIVALKEFGDRAVAKGDKVTMRYIAAKIMVQEHWMNGIAHSSFAGLLGVNVIQPALAAAPDVGASGAVSCKVTCDAIVNGTSEDKEYLWNVYRCSSCAGTLSAATKAMTKAKTDNSASNQDKTQTSAVHVYGGKTRQVCIGNNIGGVFCVAEALQRTHEIAASAIGFAENGGGKEIWDSAWANLDMQYQQPSTPSIAGGKAIETGAGVTAGKTAVPPDLTPTQKVFYADCVAKGGYIGGANQDKGRLPTTEGGAHCNYKQGANNCWEFMTNSGGQYMGGDVGCTQSGLLPIVPEPIVTPAPTPKPTTAPVTAPTKKPTTSPAPVNTPAQKQSWEGGYVGTMGQSPECKVEEWNNIGYTVSGNYVQGGVGIRGAAAINSSGFASITEVDGSVTMRATYQLTTVDGKAYLRVAQTSENHYDPDDPNAVQVCHYSFYAPRVDD